MKKKTNKPLTGDDVKEIVKGIVKKALDEQDEKVDRKFMEQRYWIDDRLMDLKSEFFNKIDPFLREIEDAREHRAIATKDDEEIKSTLDNHEKRISLLEHGNKN